MTTMQRDSLTVNETFESERSNLVSTERGSSAAIRTEMSSEQSGMRDDILNHLRYFVLVSLSSYQEIARLAINPRLKSFADVIVRQRLAQVKALCNSMQTLTHPEDNQHVDDAAMLSHWWRVAIFCIQKKNPLTFLEYAERAESFLEEAYITAAESTDIESNLAQELRDYALMVYGAQTVCEDLAQEMIAQQNVARNCDYSGFERIVSKIERK